MTEGFWGEGGGQYSHPSEDELQAILARQQSAQMQKAQVEMAQVQMQTYHTSAVTTGTAVTITVPAATVANSRVVKVTYLPPNDDLVAKGERIIDRIWLWSEVPLLGPIVTSRLADQLDRLTDALSSRVSADALDT